MTGWNMPPGCNPSDIPGNTPEDQKEDAFWDMLDKKLTEENIDTVSMQDYPGTDNVIPISDLWDDINFVKLINIARDLAWKDGYVSGQADVRDRIDDLEAKLIEKGVL